MYLYKLYVGLANVVTTQPKTKRINIFQQSLAGDLQHLSTQKKHRRQAREFTEQTQQLAGLLRTTSDYRFGRIQLEWFRVQKGSSNSNSNMQGARAGPSAAFEAIPEVSAECEIGILRLFRSEQQISEPQPITNPAEASSSLPSRESSTPANAQTGRPRVLAVLAVPGYMTPTDFLSFVAPFHDRIEHFRVLRDSSPNHYMIVMRFISSADADEFYQYYNGKTFSPLEPENCHVVYISQVGCEYTEIAVRDIEGDGRMKATEQLFMQPKWDSGDDKELPTCPVCLERLDSSASGLLTIMCQHTFHCRCLAKWGDGNCPVCRYSQTSPFVDQERFQQAVGSFPQIHLADIPTHRASGSHSPSHGGHSANNRCSVCQGDTDLWICLICGTIGCGRYVNGHAKDHFSQTQHPYSMELESQRVWDYVGDGYVHRLLQNKADGKLVELSAPAHPNPASAALAGTSRLTHDVPLDSKTAQQVPGSSADVYFEAREKLDAVTEEYEILLTSQLESQREHYEIQLARQQHQNARWPKQYADLERKFAELEAKHTALAAAQTRHEAQLQKDADKQHERLGAERREWAEERKRLEASVAKWVKKSTDDARLLAEEKALSKHLMENQTKLNELNEHMSRRMDDLMEEVRDLQFYVSAQEKVKNSGGSLEGASVVGVAEAPPPKSKGKGKRRIPRK
ncbi:hypothetical protein FBU59_001428 [Linderina macrospora]|uniref:Uncharacterized protein n=1 Tax=Linderina macrospora TaxID=4868 RepID=A0ACC1JE53_9FUNG|nr:hypothetical protein FBU59_001428 [Linderina macrospora]